MAGLWTFFFWVGVGVMAAVYVLFFVSMIRDRARKDDGGIPRQFKENTPLEIVYTIIPLVMVIVLFVVSVLVTWDVESTEGSADVEIEVVAFDWNWQFDYLGESVRVVGSTTDPAELHLPTDTKIRFHVRSADVDHSFYIPAFLYKKDAIPGVDNVFDLELTREGTFHGQCAEFCGLFHALMQFDVVVESPDEFESWLEDQPVDTQVADGPGSAALAEEEREQ